MLIDKVINLFNPAYDPTDKVEVEDIAPITEISDFMEHTYLGQDPSYSIYMPFPTMWILYLRNSWIHTAVNHITNTISILDFEIRPKEEFLEQSGDLRLQVAAKMAEMVMRRPNAKGETYQDWIQSLVRDILIYDAGFLEKVRSKEKYLVGLVAVDASTIRVDCDEHGSVRFYVQHGRASRGGGYGYLGEPALWGQDLRGKHVIIDPRDGIYFKMNTRTNSPYGVSPLLPILYAAQADLAADINLHEFLMTGGIVGGFISADEEINKALVNRLRQAFNRVQRPGQRRFIPIVSGAGDTKYVPIVGTNREMQIFELQQAMMKKILAIYNVPPNEIGLTLGVTRGTAWNQQDVFWFNAIYPLARKIEEKFTNYFVSEFDHRLEFKFLRPAEYNFDALMNRVMQLDAQGLIDYEGKIRMLGIPPPKEIPYVELMKRLESEQAKMQLEQMQKQAEQSEETAAMQKEQEEIARMVSLLQLVNTYLDLEKAKKLHELDDIEIEAQKQSLVGAIIEKNSTLQKLQKFQNLDDLELEAQKESMISSILQNKMTQAQIQQLLSGEDNKISAAQIVQLVEDGKVGVEELVALLVSGQLDEEALQQVVAILKAMLDIYIISRQLPTTGKEEESPIRKGNFLNDIIGHSIYQGKILPYLRDMGANLRNPVPRPGSGGVIVKNRDGSIKRNKFGQNLGVSKIIDRWKKEEIKQKERAEKVKPFTARKRVLQEHLGQRKTDIVDDAPIQREKDPWKGEG